MGCGRAEVRGGGGGGGGVSGECWWGGAGALSGRKGVEGGRRGVRWV